MPNRGSPTCGPVSSELCTSPSRPFSLFYAHEDTEGNELGDGPENCDADLGCQVLHRIVQQSSERQRQPPPDRVHTQDLCVNALAHGHDVGRMSHRAP